MAAQPDVPRAQDLASLQAELARTQAQAAPADAERAAALEARHKFLAALIGNRTDARRLAAMLPPATTGASDIRVTDLLAPASVRAGRKGKGAVTVAAAPVAPSTDPFRAIETQQMALVDQAALATSARLRDTQRLIRRLGLNPDRFLDADAGVGVGGPYLPVSSNADPRFRELFVSWRQLSVLQAAVTAIPAFLPVKQLRATSSFGTRSDPFNGGAAHHAGVDMAGSSGEPIFASASGTVSRAGWASGYGNLIELAHGKGIDTRYGHLSRILVKPGDYVRQGQVIGRMGSTGRSTGTHLHYEIRVDGRAVNPRPFLDASAYVLAAQGPPPEVAGPEIGPELGADDMVTASIASTGGATQLR